jgi:hypothetical protein
MLFGSFAVGWPDVGSHQRPPYRYTIPSCSLNPPIMGALVTLGYFDKKYTAVKVLEILEAIA